jgi:hypothetical protein
MAAARRIPQRWYERLQESDVWLLFVRPSTTSIPADVISRRILPIPENGVKASQAEAVTTALSAQSTLIELLQMLLHLRGVSAVSPVNRPVLGVLLSCFDEVQVREDTPGELEGKYQGGRSPGDVLREHLPLLASFVESVWAPDARVVLGVSALGRPLLRNQPDLDFILEGPENQGYVVLPEGLEDQDLTLAVSLPLELLHG